MNTDVSRFAPSVESIHLDASWVWLFDDFMVPEVRSKRTSPWYLAPLEERQDLRILFPGGPSLVPLIQFARRQDRDEVACLEVTGNRITGVSFVKTWTASGYTVEEKVPDLWTFLHRVMNDIREWHEFAQ